MSAVTPNTPVEDSTENALLNSQKSQTFGEYMGAYINRVRAGDLGILPILFGLVVIAVFFQFRNDNFLTPINLYNLIIQMAAITTIGYGIVFVLLLGEIDLSVSYISAMAGALLVIGMTADRGIPIWFGVVEGELVVTQTLVLAWWAAIPIALAIATLIGLLQGSIITYLSVPSFIVTLAGFLVWSGMVLILLGRGGTVRMSNDVINGIANYELPDPVGWLLAIIVVAVYGFFQISSYNVRKAQGLAAKPMSVIALQIGGVALLSAVVVGIANMADTANQNRGVPLVGIILLVFLGVLTFITNNTTFGRYLYAVGGNAEAARRAGINVQRIRVAAFTICGFMAGMGGIILVSRLRSISTDAGGGDLLLNSIAAAVIGGTSLFGGRGSVGSALLGAFVIASLANGMGLLGWSAGVQSVVTGIVLVLAVLLDSLSRQAQKRAGLA
ncbi:MAG: sugar ABC transporter permease [Chloroflexota bacterium]